MSGCDEKWCGNAGNSIWIYSRHEVVTDCANYLMYACVWLPCGYVIGVMIFLVWGGGIAQLEHYEPIIQ